MIADCTALILAGGDSSRMGQDKAGLLLDGATLLQRVTATMQQVFPKVIVSVRQPRAEVVLPQVCDAQADGGPLAGLVAGLAQVETGWMFAVACDMPFIRPAVITHMASLRGEHQAVVPMTDGHPQPLFAFYAKPALPLMHAAFEGGEKRVRTVLKQLDVRYVNEAELQTYDPQFRSFIDLDTPQDHAAAQELK
ncbi:MAG: molybdenum cofactor guanylyltransferase [Sideroxydans sp.]|nr:molybdenum cofactor guanylyltransferase [Sideroxydans sp.]